MRSDNMADISKLTGKFDLKGIVTNVKSILNPNTKLPSGIESDPLGQRVFDIIRSLEALKSNFEKMAEELTNLDSAIGSLSQQIVAMQKSQPGKTAVLSVAPEQAKVAPIQESKLEDK